MLSQNIAVFNLNLVGCMKKQKNINKKHNFCAFIFFFFLINYRHENSFHIKNPMLSIGVTNSNQIFGLQPMPIHRCTYVRMYACRSESMYICKHHNRVNIKNI